MDTARSCFIIIQRVDLEFRFVPGGAIPFAKNLPKEDACVASLQGLQLGAL